MRQLRIQELNRLHFVMLYLFILFPFCSPSNRLSIHHFASSLSKGFWDLIRSLDRLMGASAISPIEKRFLYPLNLHRLVF